MKIKTSEFTDVVAFGNEHLEVTHKTSMQERGEISGVEILSIKRQGDEQAMSQDAVERYRKDGLAAAIIEQHGDENMENMEDLFPTNW